MAVFQGFLENLGSAVLALVLAIMVWMVAVNEAQGPPVEMTYPAQGVPIEMINVPEGLVVFDQINRRVMVRLRGPRANIEDLSPEDFRAYVDLAGLDAGVHEVPVNLQCANCTQERVNLLSWDPHRISVRLDELMKRSVRVEVNLQGSPAVGYQTQTPTAVPAWVRISGPRSQVEKVAAVRAYVYLFNEEAPVQKEITLVAVDGEGNLVNGVTISPKRAEVTVPVIPEGRRKEVSVTPNITGTVAAGYYASNITVEPQTVVLTGPRFRIQDAPGFVETEPVSIEGAKGRVQAQVRLLIPEGLAVLEGSDTVTVTVEVSPFLGGRVFEVEPMVRDLAPGLEARISPSRVQVFLSGPLPDLETLSENDVRVIVNLKDLGPGRHKIKPLILIGRETLNKQILPEVVEVTITLIATETPPPPKLLPPVR